MRLLLDTHALLWWLDGDAKLSPTAYAAIGNEAHPVWVSAATAWEIATKVRIGKLPEAVEVAARLPDILSEQVFTPLAISVEHARKAGLLQHAHRDPFDRMLIAQAQIEGMTRVIVKSGVQPLRRRPCLPDRRLALRCGTGRC